ncbi:GNAT family N-acetyltransferase [Microbulbifer sp. SSSA008]|uniref:GNAT family N-acetyltransferase n=1 Tax=Microbulbifer sp. SSSA008 TaxID=3243380 RepID=UPI00403A2E9B
MQKIIKNPEDCSESEIRVFEKFVIEGGEVSTVGLRQRIYQAEKLIFIKDDNQFIAIGALKNPKVSYKEKIFKKSNAQDQSEYKYELGWLYVVSSARGKGYGRELMQAILYGLSKSTCFATTRENNSHMHYLLEKFGFSRMGKPYKSTKGEYTLVLYGNSSQCENSD